MSPAKERILLGLLLAATLALRLLRLDQPIVENYVGRQVPTAMVARNLDRGSGFLYPQLDTGPFPNLFLVEPPVFAALAVGLHRATGLAIEPAGRAVSAFGITLAAWGVFALTRRRQGAAVALLALVAFGLFPVTIRYGRAFQPDATALGLILAGIALMDGGGRWQRVLGGGLVAVGLGMKVIFAYALLPMGMMVGKREKAGWHAHVLVGMSSNRGASGMPTRTWACHPAWSLLLVPAALWYGHAAPLLVVGSKASADNAAIWLRVLVPTALFDPVTVRAMGWFLLVRAFTPLGIGLAVLGFARGAVGRFWVAWIVAAGLMLIWLAGKAHHEYYWLALAPPLAVGVAGGLVGIAGCRPWRLAGLAAGTAPNPLSPREWVAAKRPGEGPPTLGLTRPFLALAAGLGFASLALGMSASTWRTPREWVALARAAEVIQKQVPADAWLGRTGGVAPGG